MTILRFAGCLITGVAADTKPDHAGLTGFRFLETDTGRLYYHNGSNWTMIIGRDKTETFTNKTADAESNTLSNLLTSPFALGYKRLGVHIPSGTAAGSIHHALGGFPTAGTYSVVHDSTEGYVSRFNSSTSGDINGYKSNSTTQVISRRAWNPYIKFKVKPSTTTNSRLYIGFSANNTLPASDTILGTGEAGFLVGFSTTTSNFSIFHNDATGSMVTANIGSGIAKDTSWRTYEIEMGSSDIKVRLDGSNETTISSDIPATTTDLYFNVVLELAAASSIDLDIKSGVFRSDK